MSEKLLVTRRKSFFRGDYPFFFFISHQEHYKALSLENNFSHYCSKSSCHCFLGAIPLAALWKSDVKPHFRLGT